VLAVGDSAPARRADRDVRTFAGSSLAGSRTPTTLVPAPEFTERVDLDGIDRRPVDDAGGLLGVGDGVPLDDVVAVVLVL
jgi:hypothetical protein